MVMHPGTLLAQWDGLEVRLGFAPQLIDEQPYVHALDLQKTILPLLNGPSGKNLREPVVIDAGHGGEDAGARGSFNGCKEKDLTLDWALRLRRSLAEKGVNALLTRSKDASLTLPDRVAVAVAAHAGMFISLHFNSAAPSRNEAGLETYCLTPAGMPSSLTRSDAEEIAQAYPNNSFDAQNLQLAVQLHRALLQVNGHQDRGIRRARFPAVLRGQQCPAVLIEGGYLSSPAEARQIADPAYRQRLADALARVLATWIGKGAP
ncbi:MAG TPA: N-acetylmuramoyl-L-alanine amidase [Verrucomicrobiae bacterium]